MGPAVEITVLTKHGAGGLTKRISLCNDGTVASDGSACLMARGSARRMLVANVPELASLLAKLGPKQAIALGRLRRDLADQVDVVTKDKLNGGKSAATIARTAGNLVYAEGQPAFALIDFDRKGMPAEVAARLASVGGVWNALTSVLPALADTARVTRASTSAGLHRTDTGERLPGSGGIHVYVTVSSGDDIPRFLRALHERAWLAGYGWLMLGAGGQLLERSIVDRMVGQPERLVFEGAPILEPPLEQDQASRRPVAVAGSPLDTMRACPSLTIAEQTKLRSIKAKHELALAPEAAKARAQFIASRAQRLAERSGITLAAAQEAITRQCEGVLRPEIELPFDDPTLAGITVAELLADPDRFEGETLADPLEGPDYGRGKAKIMRRPDGTLWINSFAHGRTAYELRLDAEFVRTAIMKANSATAVQTFIKFGLLADLTEDECEDLRNLAADRANKTKTVVGRMFKTAKREQAVKHRAEELKRKLAERTDPRPLVPVPEHDAPWLPEMATINDVLTADPKAPRPQCRDIQHDLVRIARVPVPDMHALSASDANADGGKRDLTNPEQWIILKLAEPAAAEMIERHIDYVGPDNESVHLPLPFVRHSMNRDDGRLPVVAAIATLPMVLRDGSLLMPDGLDRERGVWFEVPETMRAAMPVPPACTAAAVRKAMTFLCEQWLVDVATDHIGKATIIAAALTVLERCLLPDRPAFFVTAGRRGTGKTTTITMLVKAVTGTYPAASAWSPHDEERRKALMSYLMFGVPYVLWDNIGRGEQISCPHIEKASTAAWYSDRKLGENAIITAPASAIHFFTGNNIAPRGDLASRSLRIRLTIDRHDPENRAFIHPDPVGWTEQNRAAILRALYTVLLGNPVLTAGRTTASKTRFKLWWRLVGSAVEHAARLLEDQPGPVDFSKLFLDQEDDDEETADLATALAILAEDWPTTFRASDLTDFINNNSNNPRAASLREWLFGKTPATFAASAKAVGKRLKRHLDSPVRCGDNTLTLRSITDRTDQTSYFINRKRDA